MARSRSNATPTAGAPWPLGLEEQQAIVLERLERAEGSPVSFAELREAGIELPASIVGELELSGWPIDRCRARAPDGAPGPGVRLDPVQAARFAGDQDQLDSSYRVYHTRPWAGLGGAIAAGLELRQGRQRGQEGNGVRHGRQGGEEGTGLRHGRQGGAEGTGLRHGRQGGAEGTGLRHGRQRGAEGGVRTARGEAARRWRVPLALLVGAALLVALLIAGISSGTSRRAQALSPTRASAHHRSSRSAPARRRPRQRPKPLTRRGTSRSASSAATTPLQAAAPAPTTSTAGGTTSTPSSSTPTATTPAATEPVASLANALALDARGHYLLESGQYGSAIPLLRAAMQDTGMSTGSCLQPATQACLTYAYALFDTATALQREGDPAAAVPLLEQRLQIDNQRSVVQAELALAKRQARAPAGGR